MKTFVLFIASMISLNSLKAQVVLNEVYTDPGAGKQEFFELYNTSTSQVPESLDNYTLIAYYEESGKSGFYVLDMPNQTVNAKSFYVGSSSLVFNVQGQINLSTNMSWNLLSVTGSLTKWERNGSSYIPQIVPANLNDLFVKRTASGGAYHILLFKNGILINGLIGGISTTILPSYIKSMPVLSVNMIAPAPSFAVNFSSIADNQVEYVNSVPGNDNGYIRLNDGKCGVWDKSSAQKNHTPGVTNGFAVGQTGQLTITSFISFGNPSILNYQITAGSADVFPAIVESYRDFGIAGQLDANDILFDSRQIASASAGMQQITLVNSTDQVILVAKSPAGCYDKVISVATSSSLPVKLVSFTATLNNSNKADLKWTTASEINVSHFVVERSTDGANYNDAGVVFAYGNATDKTNYNFSDNVSSIQSGIVYYRLRSVDIDGKFQYSETRIIRISKTTDTNITIQAYPNPVINELRVSIPSTWQNKKVVYELYNANGQATKRMEAASSNQTETLNVNSLAPGFYLMKVTCDGESAQQKIVKQ